MTQVSRKEILGVLFILLITATIYAQVRHFDFVWDDTMLISNNPNLEQPITFKNIFLQGLWDVPGNETSNPPFYRPIVSLAYTLEYQLFHLFAGGYHLVALFFHLMNALLVWIFCQRLRLPRVGGLIAMSIFALHPVQAHSVSFISSHGDILAVFFSLLSLIIWSHDRKKYYAYPFVLCALLSKEAALFLPIIMISYDIFVRSQRIRNPKLWIPIITWIPYFALRLLALQHVNSHEGGSALLWESAGSFRIFLLLGRMIFPIPNPPELRVPELVSWIYPLFHVAILCLGIFAFIRSKGLPMIRFLLVWFFLSIVLVADYPQVGLRFSDQFLYLPIIPVSIMVGILISEHRRSVYAYLFIGCAFVALSYREIRTWENSLTLWANAIRYDPTNASYTFYYSSALSDRHRYKEACEALDYTLKLLKETFDVSTYKMTAHNFGNCILQTDPQGAEKYYSSVIKLDPDYIPSLHNLAIAYLHQQKNQQALDTSLHLIDVRPDRSESWQLLGSIYKKLGDESKSKDAFEKEQKLRSMQSHPATIKG